MERLSKSITTALANPEIKKRHVAATREAWERPETKAAQADGFQTALPKELIIKLYKEGWLLSEIARKVGAGVRPNNGAPRLSRIRKILTRAGEYPRKKSLAAKAGK
jgi:hypothetical protein